MTDKHKRQPDGHLLKLTIDRRSVSVPAGISVLKAAQQIGIPIPSLCFHNDLSPYGGCRLCTVEIEGMRGYPLACSTIVQQGMKVKTDTAILREMRKDILQLILSEHPSSCLVCDEASECKGSQFTIRKTGVSTGCRQCPNDSQCELQKVVDQIGLTDIDYPILYHGYEVEHDDPFFDRDYNLCILCGRCIRMCQEVRGTSILAFKFRGSRVRIGPAFADNHIEAGCEFCGACVSVCPTGTLADKVSKWDGKPDGTLVSTCPFCSLGCRVDLHHKDGRLSKVTANPDTLINDGQLCLRGRYALPEATQHHLRATTPMLRRGTALREVSWQEALQAVSKQLRGLKPEDILMAVSADLVNESLFAAKKFAGTCLGTDHIDSTARWNLAGGTEVWRRLFSLPISIKAIASAEAIISVGFDSRFYFSVAGFQIRQALKNGARLVTIDARDSNLARLTDHYLQPTPGGEGLLLDFLAKRLTGGRGNLQTVAREAGVSRKQLKMALEWLESMKNLAVVVAPTAFEYSDTSLLLDGLFRLAARPETSFLPLCYDSNIRGALELGIFDTWKAYPSPPQGYGISLDDVISGRKRPKVIYLVGQVPFLERPDCDFLISQDLYLPPFAVDAFLPAKGYAECSGTLTNIEGRVQEVASLANSSEAMLQTSVKSDWQIFSELASALGSTTLKYDTVEAIQKDIHTTFPGFPKTADRRPRRLIPEDKPNLERIINPVAGDGSYLLILRHGGFQHRGLELSTVVEGLEQLSLESGLRLNSEDLDRLGIEPGEPVIVSFDKRMVKLTTCEDPDCPVGAAYVFRPLNFGGMQADDSPEFFSSLPSNPVRVNIAKCPPGQDAK